MKSHKELDVWILSIDFLTIIYRTIIKFPKYELFGLSSQMKRSAVSIPSNIAEGSARISTKEFIHFLSIASGSLSELETQLIISKNLNFIDNVQFEEFNQVIVRIRLMLKGLINSLRNNIK